jgi:myosin-5
VLIVLQLQHQFNQQFFKKEQEDYIKEGVPWTKIAFTDNQACVDLIECKPFGILPMIDEECMVPKGTDATLLAKLLTKQAKNTKLAKSMKFPTHFSVKHYAGDVVYNSQGFLDKNRQPEACLLVTDT